MTRAIDILFGMLVNDYQEVVVTSVNAVSPDSVTAWHWNESTNMQE